MQQQLFNFMGLREDPFHVSPDPRFFYSTPAHESALVELLFGIETRKGFMVLSGEAGTGKTTLLNHLIDWLRHRRLSAAYVFHARLEPLGLFRFILKEFGVPCESKSKSELVDALYTWLLQRHAVRDFPVLILDEAQALPLQTLDELRLLLNLETPRGKLLQIILAGQPELEEKLRLPALRQLRQRIMFHSRLPRLSESETAAYISSRLAAAGCSDSSLFPEDVIQDIHACSGGIPRVVNLLCEHALISAYSEQQHVVAPEMILRIAADFDLCANPLAIGDTQYHSRYSPLVEFPFSEKLTQAPADFRAAIKEGYDYTLPEPAPLYEAHALAQCVPQSRSHSAPQYKAPVLPYSVAQPVAQSTKSAPEAFPVPQFEAEHVAHSVAEPVAQSTVESVPEESPMAEVGPASPAPLGAAPKLYRYRRWGKRRSPAAQFARDFAASIDTAWFAFYDKLESYAHTIVRSISRKSSKPAPLPAVAETVPESQNIPQPFYRRRRSQFSAFKRNASKFTRDIAAFGRNSAKSLRGAWYAFGETLESYAPTVKGAFALKSSKPAPRLANPAPSEEFSNISNHWQSLPQDSSLYSSAPISVSQDAQSSISASEVAAAPAVSLAAAASAAASPSASISKLATSSAAMTDAPVPNASASKTFAFPIGATNLSTSPVESPIAPSMNSSSQFVAPNVPASPEATSKISGWSFAATTRSFARNSAAKSAQTSAAFARNSVSLARNSAASIQRAGHSFADPVLRYLRSVTQSFFNDCRRFSRALTLPSPALELGSSANGSGAAHKSPVPRDLLAPIINWLRQPVSPRNILSTRPSRPAHRK